MKLYTVDILQRIYLCITLYSGYYLSWKNFITNTAGVFHQVKNVKEGIQCTLPGNGSYTQSTYIGVIRAKLFRQMSM